MLCGRTVVRRALEPAPHGAPPMHRWLAKIAASMALAMLLSPLGAGGSAAADFYCEEPSSGKGTYRIVGGTDARVDDWPFIVAAEGAGYLCGGSVISHYWVLTAAHCEAAMEPGVARVRLAGRGGQMDGATAEIEAFIPHPNYRVTTNPEHYYNDIALVKLRAPLPVPKTDFAILANRKTERGFAKAKVCAATAGWGALGTGQVGPSRLQNVEVPVLSHSDCAQGYGPGLRNDPHLCAGYLPGGRDSCQGDSGGPLIVREGPTGYLQIGVVSYGYGCAEPNLPGVYARVSSYRDWIFKTIADNE